MVFVLPFVWTTAAATLSATAVVVATSYFMWTLQIPFYELHPQRIFDPQLSWQKQSPVVPSTTCPTTVRHHHPPPNNNKKSGLEFQATVRTLVQTEIMDHHFIHADIYAATFDIFYPTTWKGTVLAHIGNVRDLSLMKQQQQQQQQQQQDETSSCGAQTLEQQSQKSGQPQIHNETASSLSSSSFITDQGPSSPSSLSSYQQQRPLWTLQPRQSLHIHDDLRLTLLPSLFHSLSTLSHILWSFWKSGKITIPTTGVAHVRAGLPGGGTTTTKTSASVSVTIRLVCENILSIFPQMTLVGNKCTIHGFTTGWSNLQMEQEKVQHYLQDQFRKTGRLF